MTKLEQLYHEYNVAKTELQESIDAGCDDLIIRRDTEWLDNARSEYQREFYRRHGSRLVA